ncbi:hypothetical protein AM587_10000753 [Phytophthora nicotianae]|uniref:HAT C-terminal dimerisation domain-containing protein n=1 Tax=Phytophthora nicotianae TaxID=4792 RepID=A0A0W8E018_PHYNI|nr:hypothetical protein AM587_10000753 [Phytophthora nicotianae]
MTKGIGLQWEWCMPYLTNAATNTAFGIALQRKASKNFPATDLVSRIASTTFAVRSNASMESLFSELCEMANAGATIQLIEHKEHRFMGFDKVVRCLLEKWDQLEDWFQGSIDKAIPKIVRLCDEQLIIDPEQPHLRMDEDAVARNIASVKKAVLKRLRALLLTISSGSTHTSTSAETYRMSSQHVTPQHLTPGFESLSSFIELPSIHPPQVFSEELIKFAEEAAEHVERLNVHEARIDEELERRFSDPSRLLTTTIKTESILQFWKRQQDENNYRLLSIAARVIYAIPASSAQIERDFGISGMLVTSYRTNTAKHNIDMCSFLNRNRQFVDVVNCPRVTDSDWNKQYQQMY